MYSTLTVANLLLHFVDLISNIFACKFIKDTFNISQSLYRILWIDSITIIIALISGLLVNITIFVSSIQYGHIGCFILGYLSVLGFYISPILAFLISVIRFFKLNNPESGWKPNEYILKIIQWTVLGSYLYVFYLAISSVVFHHGAFVNNFYVCVKEEPPVYKTGLSMTVSLVLGSLLLAIMLSVALDIFSLWKLRKLEGTHRLMPKRNQIQSETNFETIATINIVNLINAFPERKIFDEIPIRSSLINTLFLLLYLFMMISVGIIGKDFAKQEYRALMEIHYHLMTICRTWLVATLTFKKNDANRQRNANEERERMRQVEIQDAIKKRRNRIKEGGDDPSSEINELKDDDSTLKIGSELPIIAIIGRTIRVRPLDCNCGGICSLNH